MGDAGRKVHGPPPWGSVVSQLPGLPGQETSLDQSTSTCSADLWGGAQIPAGFPGKTTLLLIHLLLLPANTFLKQMC